MRWVRWIEADIARLVIDCDDVAGSTSALLKQCSEPGTHPSYSAGSVICMRQVSAILFNFGRF